jgi:hypothetical protein
MFRNPSKIKKTDPTNIIKIKNEATMWMSKLILKMDTRRSKLLSPCEYDINRWEEAAKVVFMNASITVIPATKLYNPKSELPKTFNIIREVYKEMNNVIIILAYKYPEFISTLLDVLIIDYSKFITGNKKVEVL